MSSACLGDGQFQLDPCLFVCSLQFTVKSVSLSSAHFSAYLWQPHISQCLASMDFVCKHCILYPSHTIVWVKSPPFYCLNASFRSHLGKEICGKNLPLLENLLQISHLSTAKDDFLTQCQQISKHS